MACLVQVAFAVVASAWGWFYVPALAAGLVGMHPSATKPNFQETWELSLPDEPHAQAPGVIADPDREPAARGLDRP